MKMLKFFSISFFFAACFLLSPHIASAQEATSRSIGASFLNLSEEWSDFGKTFYLAPEGKLTIVLDPDFISLGNGDEKRDPSNPPIFSSTFSNIILNDCSYLESNPYNSLDGKWIAHLTATTVKGENTLIFSRTDGYQTSFKIIVE